jgi:hypothetical protein
MEATPCWVSSPYDKEWVVTPAFVEPPENTMTGLYCWLELRILWYIFIFNICWKYSQLYFSSKSKLWDWRWFSQEWNAPKFGECKILRLNSRSNLGPIGLNSHYIWILGDNSDDLASNNPFLRRRGGFPVEFSTGTLHADHTKRPIESSPPRLQNPIGLDGDGWFFL